MTVATYTGVVRDGKVELPSLVNLPEGSEVYIVIPERLTEHKAKRLANGWLISEVGNMLMADHGRLQQNEQGWVWRFEVYITSLAHDPWGPIGYMSISAATGNVLNEQKTKEALHESGRTFKRSL